MFHMSIFLCLIVFLPSKRCLSSGSSVSVLCIDLCEAWDLVDLIILDMVYFNVIWGLYPLAPYNATLDYSFKKVTLATGRVHLVWVSRELYFLRALQMVDKGCFSYLAYIHYSTLFHCLLWILFKLLGSFRIFSYRFTW